MISDLLYLEKDGGVNDPSRAVWLQTSLYINTTPADTENDIAFDQQSFVNIALGGVANGGLAGARRGGASVDFDTCNAGCINREQFAFTGDIASLAGPDGSHFLGKNEPNIVIGFDSTGTHNIGRDIPLVPIETGEDALPIPQQVENQSGSTYHIGVGHGAVPNGESQTLQGPIQGYAAGLVESKVPTGRLFVNVVASQNVSDMGLSFNHIANTLSAEIKVYDVQNYDGATSAYQFSFGDTEDSSGRSAYINDKSYAAIESQTNTAQVFKNSGHVYDLASATSYIASGDQLGVTSYFPETFTTVNPDGTRPFCDNCEFLQWGVWGSRVGFGDATASDYVDNVHLGWWIAGDITSTEALADVDNFTALGPTAYYDGSAIGTVANNLDGSGWKTYTATGDLTMSWSFAHRLGDLTISHFDRNVTPEGLTFGGLMCAPGVTCGQSNFVTPEGNHFGGRLAGQLPGDLGSLSGSAVGSFVNKGSNLAAGVLGNWNVSNAGIENSATYKATGIFGGSLRPGGQ